MDRRICQPTTKPKENYSLFFEQCICCSVSLVHQKRTNTGLCNDCLKDLPWLIEQCPKCALPQGDNHLCETCISSRPPYQKAYAAFCYAFPVAELIYKAKHNNSPIYLHALTKQLAALMAVAHATGSLPQALLPVPMHKKDMRKRGFNQAELIGEQLGQRLGIPIRRDIILKTKQTPKQHTLNKAKRALNLKESFVVSHAAKGLSHVAIIDDVMTTGTTVNALCEALYTINPRLKIEVWVLARTASTSDG